MRQNFIGIMKKKILLKEKFYKQKYKQKGENYGYQSTYSNPASESDSE